MNCFIIFYVSGGGAISAIHPTPDIPDLTNVKSNDDITIIACCDAELVGKSMDQIKSDFTVNASGKLVAV